jgi:hypothetical protein
MKKFYRIEMNGRPLQKLLKKGKWVRITDMANKHEAMRYANNLKTNYFRPTRVVEMEEVRVGVLREFEPKK